MAEAWGVPPWVIEDDASQEWAERFVAYRTTLNERQKREYDRQSRSSGTGNVTVTELLD